MRMIPLAKPYFTEEEVDEVRRTLNSGWVAQGPRVKELEERIAEYIGVTRCLALNSCTSALHLSLLANGISKGDKVIVPDFTYIATGNVVLHVGAEPVIVDIDPATFCIDVDGVKEKVDDGVKAIMPVHAFGYPANIQDINRIAEEYGLVVIEDAALALGSEVGGRKIGAHGNTTCFSLQGRKVITTGEGGLVVTRNNDIAEMIKAYRSQGGFPQTVVQGGVNSTIFKIVGLSYRLSDIQAGIGLVQMRRINDFIKRRIYLARYYNDLFDDYGLDIQTPLTLEAVKQNYQTYAVLLNRGNRDKVILNLKDKGIESTIGTYSLNAQPLFHRREEFPNSKYAFERSLALPMYHELTEEDILYIVKSIKSILS
jgi:dTDP-4-amino-4,6-dideoxygalactose transaminase